MKFPMDSFPPVYEPGAYLIKPNGDKFLLNEDELRFSNAVSSALLDAGIYQPLQLTYKSNNIIDYSFAVPYGGTFQIGRVKLRGKTNRMQILTADDVFWLEDINFDTAISLIEHWVSYAKTLCENI